MYSNSLSFLIKYFRTGANVSIIFKIMFADGCDAYGIFRYQQQKSQIMNGKDEGLVNSGYLSISSLSLEFVVDDINNLSSRKKYV